MACVTQKEEVKQEIKTEDCPEGALAPTAQGVCPEEGGQGTTTLGRCCCSPRSPHLAAASRDCDSANPQEVILPAGAHPQDIVAALVLVTVALAWAFLVSLTDNIILAQFPFLSLLAVLATGGLEEENQLHELLYTAASPEISREEEETSPPLAADWDEWSQNWKPLLAKSYLKREDNKHLLKDLKWFRRYRLLGTAIGALALLSIPFVLGIKTKFKWIETTRATSTDLAALPDDGVVALCGSSNCKELSPDKITFLGTGGTWSRQTMMCNDMATIECEQPDLEETEDGQDASFTYEVQFIENDVGEESLTRLYVQLVDPNDTQIMQYNSSDFVELKEDVDGLWWSTLLDDGSAFLKIRWSSSYVDARSISYNEVIISFTGSRLVTAALSGSDPLCFTTWQKKTTDIGSWNQKVDHSLAQSVAIGILESAVMNTFFTNGLSGNPYHSAHIFSDVSSSPTLLDAVALATANNRSNTRDSQDVSMTCATGTLENDNIALLESFLTSPDQQMFAPQVDHVDVVWAGDLSWEIETEIKSRGFTELFFRGEDIVILTCTALFVLWSIFLFTKFSECKTFGNGFVENAKLAAANGLKSAVGSLVGRLAVVLIVGEASVYLKLSAHEDASRSNDDFTNAMAVVYKGASGVLLFTIFVGDAIYAPKCWFPTSEDKTKCYPKKM